MLNYSNISNTVSNENCEEEEETCKLAHGVEHAHSRAGLPRAPHARVSHAVPVQRDTARCLLFFSLPGLPAWSLPFLDPTHILARQPHACERAASYREKFLGFERLKFGEFRKLQRSEDAEREQAVPAPPRRATGCPRSAASPHYTSAVV